MCARLCVCESTFATLSHSSCFWDSIKSKNDHVIFVCHLNAYLLFDAQPTRSSNCQAVRPLLSHHIFFALFLPLHLCAFYFISFHFILFHSLLDRVHQLSSMATDSKEPNQLFDCCLYTNIIRANVYAKRKPQQTTSALKPNKEGKNDKDETNHLNSVPHWINSNSGACIYQLCGERTTICLFIFIRVECVCLFLFCRWCSSSF